MKNVLITGGTGGIGSACVKLFAENGYDTALLYRSDDAMADELAGRYGTVCFKCDLSTDEGLTEAGNKVLEYFPSGFDVLVNNAGISGFGTVSDISLSEWNRMMSVDLTSVFYFTKIISAGMLSRKRGSIVNVSSIWGISGASCESHYSAAKGGVISFTRACASEFGPSGVRCNAVCPGLIDTKMNARLSDAEKEEFLGGVALGRAGRPEEVASLIYYLASDASSYVTGQVICADGGFLI